MAGRLDESQRFTFADDRSYKTSTSRPWMAG